MSELEKQIESILLFKNEPVSLKEISDVLKVKPEEARSALENLQEFYRDRGVVVIFDGEMAAFGTHPDNSELIEKIQKEELSRELGRAGLETLAVVLYRGLVSRREIDRIRGVNSSFVLRTLLIRGLIERTDLSTSSGQGTPDRSYTYKPTLKLLEYLGVTRLKDLPEYEESFKKIEEFVKTKDLDKDA